ncbi:hypothetical protein SSABA_v1c04780 [Spiroplasma sabaudiense Ar-1343]|uniref:Transmembrane protein n=1 Tax=Spiroplasma sabaudiense Ar-1343 TaxID=1276257 RepID=W6AAK6_9MOLU|nr:hypothetical protein [Spiroplasma sabaudiense]AHI53885.1 hypothetical protein SSABA_v1c04780 [Spiroplasma sabaudiense Ar-1343]
MNFSKNYEEISILLNNIILDEKLRTNLTEDEKFQNYFIDQVNNLLSMEIDFSIDYLSKKWAAIFGKSLVNITKKKIKFTKTENNTEDNVFADYSILLKYLENNYQIEKDKIILSESEINEETIGSSTIVTPEMKAQYLKIDEKIKVEPEIVNDSTEKPNINANQGFKGTMGNNGGEKKLPTHPTQDPRFYPFKTKPKGIATMKLVMSSLLFLFALLLFVFYIIGISKPFIINDQSEEIKKLFNNFSYYNNEGNWVKIGTNLSLTNLANVTVNPFNSAWIQPGMQFWILIIFCGWSGSIINRQPKNLIEKYSLSGWSIFWSLIAISFSLSLFSPFISEPSLKNLYLTHFRATFSPGSGNYTDELFLKDFNLFWDIFYKDSLLNIMSIFSIILLILAVAIVISALFVLILNPRKDHEKIYNADQEYQKVLLEAMQGREYKINPSIYETEVFIPKTKKTIKDKKNKNDDKEDSDKKESENQ